MRALVLFATLFANPALSQDLLIDDFRSADGRSALGTSWQGFSDRVMGGLSELRAGRRDGDAGPALVLAGKVRLENNGGFIQVRLPLHPGGRSFDARPWQGVALRVRGRPGAYYVHLRSRDTGLPWQYYAAPVELDSEWQDVRLPFGAFQAQSLRAPLDLASLRSLAVVAYGEAFEAEIEIARVALYADL